MKHTITFTTKDEAPLLFQDLASGDMFYIEDNFNTLYLKLNEVQAFANKEALNYCNAVTVDCGRITYVSPLTHVCKIIRPLYFSEADLISTKDNHCEEQ